MIKKFFCIILFLISGILSAKNSPSKEVTTTRVKELTSSYGIKFWYHRDDSAPLINIALAFKNCGAAHMEKTKRSVPTLYSNIDHCGNEKYSKEEFEERLDNISVSFYCRADFDNVMFFCKYPKMVSNEAVDLFLLALTSPKFEKKEVEKWKNSQSYFLKTYQNGRIFWFTSVMMPKILFENHPYGDGWGSSEDVLKLTSADLESFRKNYIVRSNVELCIFGNISEAEAIELANKILARIPQGNSAPDNIKNVEIKLQNCSRNFYDEGPQSYILFALPNVLESSERKFAATVLYLVLGGYNFYFKNRIIKKLRSELGLIYGGGISKTELKHACFSTCYLQTSNKNVDTAISEIKLILKQLKENGISQEELDFAKSNIKGSFLVGLRTANDLCSFYMTKKLQGHSLHALEEFLQGINAVTLEQVNSIAKELLDENNLPIVVVGGKE